ncbi:hypothetical protein A4A49_24653 [Nicotiana attenuata]|uniref:Uncharacterized protein n=1 Tax=Nicotiana attenuata TaxID=49451 RepID=A0A314LD50_NICAT|nr:hypothetical protein A4A49_24653 [Nicotiana attenuata]
MGGNTHDLHECALALLIDHRNDSRTLVTIGTHPDTAQGPFDDHCKVEQHAAKRMDKGKGHAFHDALTQHTRPKNKPCQKKRRALQWENAGISIVEPLEEPPDKAPVIYSHSTSLMTRHIPNQGDSFQFISGDGIHMVTSHSDKDTPDDDEYRPIQSEDELTRGLEEDDRFSDGADEDQYWDLLLAAVNCVAEQDNVTSSHEKSSRMRPSPTLTRSKAASSSSNPSKSRTPIILK